MLNDMINDASFRIGEDIAIKVPDELISTTISLGLLPSRSSKPELFPLSGFPRYLVTENKSTGQSCKNILPATFTDISIASRLQKRAEVLKTKIKKSEMLISPTMYDVLAAAADQEAETAMRIYKAAEEAGRPSTSSDTSGEQRPINNGSPNSSKTSLGESFAGTLDRMRARRNPGSISEISVNTTANTPALPRYMPSRQKLRKLSSDDKGQASKDKTLKDSDVPAVQIIQDDAQSSSPTTFGGVIIDAEDLIDEPSLPASSIHQDITFIGGDPTVHGYYAAKVSDDSDTE